MTDLQPENNPSFTSNLQTAMSDSGNRLKRNKVVFLLLPFGLLLLFLVLFLTIFSQETTDTITPTPSTPQNNPTLTPTIAVIPTASEPVSLQNPEITWSPRYFSESESQNVGFQKTVLADNEIKYSYPSSNPNRPNEMIVKDGTVIYQRTVVSDKYTYHYTNSLDAPDYNFQGSRFYGSNTVVYVYLKSGTAFVTDANTTLVKEQILFQPMNIEDFKQKYGGDILDFTIIPTLPEE